MSQNNHQQKTETKNLTQIININKIWSYLIVKPNFKNTFLKTEAKDTKTSEVKDSLSKDRLSGAQGQLCPKPRPSPRIQRGSDLKKMFFAPKFRKFSGKFKQNSSIL